jgi:hypothetical protein
VPDNCPHCGTRLPAVVDAYCSECRGDLSAPGVPQGEAPPAHAGAIGGSSGTGTTSPWLFLFLALVCAAVGSLKAVQGDRDEALSVGFGATAFWLWCAAATHLGVSRAGWFVFFALVCVVVATGNAVRGERAEARKILFWSTPFWLVCAAWSRWGWASRQSIEGTSKVTRK